MFRLSLALLAAVAAPAIARAADLALSSRIDAVTVFPDAAAVTRLGEARVPAGQHVLVMRGLPAALDPASIRIEGMADGGLAIGSVDVRRAPAETQPTEKTARRLKELRAELARARGRVDALEAQKRAVADFARIAAEAAAKEGRGFDVERARAAWQAVGEGTAATNEAQIAEQQRIADLEAEIRAAEAAAGRGRPGIAPIVDVAVTVEAEREVAARFSVTYRVGGARWTPLYDARLDTQAPGAAKVELVRRASVTQRTGEDWTDVALTLSTTRVAGGTGAPEVGTLALNLREPITILETSRQRTLAAPAPMAAPQAEADSVGRGAPVQAAQEREAQAQSTAFSASFSPAGRVSVSRDGAARSFRLSTHTLDAPLTARVAPSLETRAYLSTALAWADEVPLLPGEVSLTRDGVFVGKGRIGAVAAGDTVELGFGADERIKVERAPVRRRDNDPSGWAASRTQISDHRTTITNLHRRPMRISVIDRIPVSENQAVTVEPLPTNTAPTERTVQDRRGVMGWTHDYQPGEKREIRLGWRLRWPADRDLMTN